MRSWEKGLPKLPMVAPMRKASGSRQTNTLAAGPPIRHVKVPRRDPYALALLKAGIMELESMSHHPERA